MAETKKNPAVMWKGDDELVAEGNRPSSPAEYYREMFPQNTDKGDEEKGEKTPSKS